MGTRQSRNTEYTANGIKPIRDTTGNNQVKKKSAENMATGRKEQEDMDKLKAYFDHCKGLFEEEVDPKKLTSSLISEGILEPEEEEKVSSVQKNQGRKAGASELWGALRSKLDEDEADAETYESILNNLSSIDYLVNTMNSSEFKEKAWKEWKETENLQKAKKSKPKSSIFIVGSNNSVINNSDVRINNYH